MDKIRQVGASATVIITCYNLERYVGDAIRSVLAQTFDGELEIIAVDDCSTDGSADIIRSFPEVRYVRTERNGGVLLATLSGIETSTSENLFFLDGDDVWDPGKVAAVMARFAADGRVGLVTHDLTYVDQAGQPLARETRPGREMAEVSSDGAGEKVRRGILGIHDYVWLGSAYAVRNSVIELGGFVAFARSLPDPANTYQDWPLAFWVAAQRKVLLDYVPAKLFSYRLHDLNYSGDARTAELMLRNLRRTRNTVQAMLQIAIMRDLPESKIRIVQDRIHFTEYLIALYQGRRIRAGRRFWRIASDLRRRRVFGKELMRLLAVGLVGPAKFARLASRRKVLRNLPTT
ncbi:MAG TPA: glycosyltransferase [Sphingomicrobium sp.]